MFIKYNCLSLEKIERINKNKMNITRSIKHFNQCREKGVKKMTQERLGYKMMPTEKLSTTKYLMSRWNKGYYNQLKASHIKKMCEILQVDADFLLSSVETKKYNLDDISANGLFSVMNHTGFTANRILNIKSMKS